MVQTLGSAVGRICSPERWQRLYRKRDLDNYSRIGHDIAHRGFAKCISQRIRANYQQSQFHSVTGNAFIELLLVLPVLLLLILGLVTATTLTMANLSAGQAAENGLSVWVQGNSQIEASQAVTNTLVADGYSAQGISDRFYTQNAMRSVEVSIPVYLWDVGRVGQVNVTRTGPPLPATSPSVSGGGGTGQPIVILHHFPMW